MKRVTSKKFIYLSTSPFFIEILRNLTIILINKGKIKNRSLNYFRSYSNFNLLLVLIGYSIDRNTCEKGIYIECLSNNDVDILHKRNNHRRVFNVMNRSTGKCQTLPLKESRIHCFSDNCVHLDGKSWWKTHNEVRVTH